MGATFPPYLWEMSEALRNLSTPLPQTPKEMEEQSERPSSLRGSMASDKLPLAKHSKTPAKKKVRRQVADAGSWGGRGKPSRQLPDIPKLPWLCGQAVP